MSDDREVDIDRVRAADELAELDGGKTTPGSLAAETPTANVTRGSNDTLSEADEVLAEANAEVPVPIAMSPAEVDARADAVEAVEAELEDVEPVPSKKPQFNELRPEP